MKISCEQMASIVRFVVEHEPHETIKCMKIIRTFFDLGLAEAKDLVESVNKPRTDPVVDAVRKIFIDRRVSHGSKES